MDATISISSLLAVAGAISAIGGAWLTLRKINKDVKKDREEQSAKILQLAKEQDAKLKVEIESKRTLLYQELDSKIEGLKKDFENLKTNVDKDLEHLKETYANELKSLGDKIENLREEIRNSNNSLVGLLTKLIEKDN